MVAKGIEFSYDEAFRRNLGLVSETEQARLKATCVALPGLGGVGGMHLQALARMGIGSFHLADPYLFEVTNINRQLGATLKTLGRGKTEVMAETALAINPSARVTTFPEGISLENIDAFLAGVDVVVDGIEFFAIEIRRMLYAACRRHGIPVVHAGPIGYGATVFVFTPEGPSFDEQFRIDDSMTYAEKLLSHAVGHSRGFSSDVDASRVDFKARTGPALSTACLLCSAVAATEVLKLVCGRGALIAAPNGIYIDPYRCRNVSIRPRPSLTRSWRGRIVRWFVFRRFPDLREMHERELQSRCSIPLASNFAEASH